MKDGIIYGDLTASLTAFVPISANIRGSGEPLFFFLLSNAKKNITFLIYLNQCPSQDFKYMVIAIGPQLSYTRNANTFIYVWHVKPELSVQLKFESVLLLLHTAVQRMLN